VPEDLSTFSHTLGHCLNNAFGYAVVAEHKGELTGFMFGCATPLWFARARAATDIVTYAETPGDGYRMIRRFMKWAWSIPNVVEVTLAQSSGLDVERSGKIYERCGLARVGGLFTAVRPKVAAEEAA